MFSKSKNLTTSIDGECPLVSLCDILRRSDANRRNLRVYTTIDTTEVEGGCSTITSPYWGGGF